MKAKGEGEMSQNVRLDSSNVIRFTDTLDASEVVRMKSRLTRLLNRHPKMVLLDLAATKRVELAGLGMLLDRLRRLGNGHSTIRFSNASSQVYQTLARAGVNGLLLS